MQVRIARSAETDLLEGYVFYEEQQAGIGEYLPQSSLSSIVGRVQPPLPNDLRGLKRRPASPEKGFPSVTPTFSWSHFDAH